MKQVKNAIGNKGAEREVVDNANTKTNTTSIKTIVKVEDLKGKKVDGDPALPEDQPIDQLHKEEKK